MFLGSVTLTSGISTRSLPENAFPARSGRPMTLLSRRTPSSFMIQAFTQTAPPPETGRIDYRKPMNFYEILCIKETASPAEIKTAYRGLAKRFHPDAVSSQESNGQDFIEVNRAYATLSDPMARERYDVSIGAGRRFRFSPENRPGFVKGFQTRRRWETDQCW